MSALPAGLSDRFISLNAEALTTAQRARVARYIEKKSTMRSDSMKADRRWFCKNDNPPQGQHLLSYPLSNVSDHYMGLFHVEKKDSRYQGLIHQVLMGRDYGVCNYEFMRAKLLELQAIAGEGNPVRVLDLGCGQGVALFELLKFADSIGVKLVAYGVDLILPSIWGPEAKKPLPPETQALYSHYVEAGRLVIRQGSIDNLCPNEEAASEDWTGMMHMVVSVQVMRYVEDRIKVIEEVHRALAAGGEAFLDDQLEYFSVFVDGGSRTLLLDREFFPRLNQLPGLNTSGFSICRQADPFLNIRTIKIKKGAETRPLILGLIIEPTQFNFRYVPLNIPEEEKAFFPQWEFIGE